MDIKIVRKKGQPPQAQFSLSTPQANVIVVVGLDGYNYRHYTRDSKWSNTKGKNVHLSMNGPIMLDFDEMGKFLNELSQGVNEAKKKLQELT